MRKNTKALVWSTDFIFGLLIFSLALILYFAYSTNLSKEGSGITGYLVSDVKSVSSSVLSAGDWDAETVLKLGITNNDYRIDGAKVRDFKDIPYDETKKILGTVYDYLIFFTDEEGNLIEINGVCSLGYPGAEVTYELDAAYYYRNEDDSFIKDFMINEFNADLYHDSGGTAEEFELLADNLNNYDLVVLEHALVPTAKLAENELKLQDYVDNGGLMMISGELTTPNTYEVFGVEFWKQTGQAEKDEDAEVIAADEYLSLVPPQTVNFAQTYYTINIGVPAADYKKIAWFTNDKIDVDNAAIARWEYGDGSIFYFSDFDENYFAEDFVDKVEETIVKWGKFKCANVDLSTLDYDDFVKVERILIHDSKPIKLVFYIWR